MRDVAVVHRVDAAGDVLNHTWRERVVPVLSVQLYHTERTVSLAVKIENSFAFERMCVILTDNQMFCADLSLLQRNLLRMMNASG